MQSLYVDQSRWGLLRVTGADRTRFIQGMCTANVETLAAGQWRRACMLNVKGRVMSVFDVVNREDHLLLICESEVADDTLALLDKHAIMDDVGFERVEIPVHRVWSSPQAVWDAPPVFAPCPEPAASAAAIEIRRVEAGMPRMGADVGPDYFPFESPLAATIDYEKGCYIGQEPVARVHARGAAQKALRGLRVAGEAAVEVGAAVSHERRPGAGQVTSAVVSPEFGSIALAYLHRTVWDPGERVVVAGRSAEVTLLPFA